jgi:hypothetical protein
MENQLESGLCKICNEPMTEHEARVLKTCYPCAEAEHIIDTGCPTLVVGEEFNCVKTTQEKLRMLIERGWRPPIKMF